MSALRGVNTERLEQVLIGAPQCRNRYMNRAASGALVGVDVVLFVVEAGNWTDGDSHVLGRLATAEAPIVVAANKIDRISDVRPGA